MIRKLGVAAAEIGTGQHCPRQVVMAGDRKSVV